jgi:DNA-binding NarL/FixJ family response regulator
MVQTVGKVAHFMIKIGLYSEDRTLHPLLSSALGKEFLIVLKSDQQEMSDLVSAGECDVMILDLNSNHESLQERIGFSRRLIASTVPSVIMADDGLRSTAFELVRTGAFGYCRRPPSIRDLKTMLSRAYENSTLKRSLRPCSSAWKSPACDQPDRLQPADAARLPDGATRHQPQRRRAGHRRERHRQGTHRPRHSQYGLARQAAHLSPSPAAPSRKR